MVTALSELEAKFKARMGVWAFDTGRNITIQYRADERFAYCSTVKTFLAAAMLKSRSTAQMNELVHYKPRDLIIASPITENHLADGLTWTQL